MAKCKGQKSPVKESRNTYGNMSVRVKREIVDYEEVNSDYDALSNASGEEMIIPNSRVDTADISDEVIIPDNIEDMPERFAGENDVEVKVESISDKESDSEKTKQSTSREREDDRCDRYVIVLKATRKKWSRSKPERRYKCAICGRAYPYRSSLMPHIRKHTGDRPYKCNMCDATFYQTSSLRNHKLTHNDVKQFQCEVCFKEFNVRGRLVLHMRIHTGEKPYKCKLCKKAFARKSHLNRHMDSHSEDKPFKCSECGVGYKSNPALQNHMKTHEGSTIVKCRVCNKKLANEQRLAQHMRTMHRVKEPKTCTICGKKYKGNLDGHMRLHYDIRDFKCTMCDATFIQKSQLNVHLRTHTGERPYKCEICGLGFTHTTVCRIHMRMHTGEKPFQCVLCSAAFKQLPHLKKHMSCVHDTNKPYFCITCEDIFQTRDQLVKHEINKHDIDRTEEIAQESVLASLRKRLAILIHRISTDENLTKFGYGTRLVDDVLKDMLSSSEQSPVNDKSLSRISELRKNMYLLLEWTIPKETLNEYLANDMMLDEIVETLTA